MHRQEAGLEDGSGSGSAATVTAPSALPFSCIFTVAAVLLVLVVLAAFTVDGPFAWSVGFVYIAYDTWVLVRMVRASSRAVRSLPAKTAAAGSGGRIPLTILIAARNEQEVLPDTFASLLSQTEPAEQVILIDDGSADGTEDWLVREWGVSFRDDGTGRSGKFPGLLVIRKENSGKAASLNAALSHATGEAVVTLDADTMLEPDALRVLRDGFAEGPEITVVCGVLRPVCRPAWSAPFFRLCQTYEYLRSFLWRFVWMKHQVLVLVSGAFSAFRLKPLTEAGGFDETSQVEDYELMFRLHRRSLERGVPLGVRVMAGSRATTDCPSTPVQFLRQRTRWFAGFLDTLFRHRDMVGHSRYGRLGTRHLVIKTCDMLMPLYGLWALAALIMLLATGSFRPNLLIIGILAAKFAADIFFHAWSVNLYTRWMGGRLTAKTYLKSLAATLIESFLFQIFRQTGAALGWVAFLRGRIGWSPQRPVRADIRPH